MQIFIDETGSFSGVGKFPSVSLVGALVVGDTVINDLKKIYGTVRKHLPKDRKSEVKGRSLNERQIAKVVSLLLEHGAIFEAVLIDLGTHTEDGLSIFQAQQAEKLTANLTENHNPKLVGEVKRARSEFEKFKSPSVVQAILTIDLIWRVLEFSTMYFSTRRPEELGSFHWVVDAKGTEEKPTNWEVWWSKFILPALQTKSFSEPLKQLPLGDYSHMERFETEADPFLREKSKWKEGGPRPLDIGKILGESFKFSPSGNRGIELVDIVVNATRRALNGNLQPKGWARIPELMIHRKGPYISLTSLQDDPDPNRVYPYQEALMAFGKGGRTMLPPHLRTAEF